MEILGKLCTLTVKSLELMSSSLQTLEIVNSKRCQYGNPKNKNNVKPGALSDRRCRKSAKNAGLWPKLKMVLVMNLSQERAAFVDSHYLSHCGFNTNDGKHFALKKKKSYHLHQ